MHHFASLGQVFFQTGLTAERRCTGIGVHTHAVLRNTLQPDRTGSSECGYVVGEYPSISASLPERKSLSAW